MAKIRIAFIKFGGLSAGGTERWLQMMAANLPKDRFEVDYYYCDAAPYLGSDSRHADTNPERLKYMLDNQVNLIKFKVGFKDVTVSTHDWIKTDFWEKFDESKYDIVQAAKAGPAEYPFNKMKKVRIVDSVHLLGVDHNPNIFWTCFLSEWSRLKWSQMGGSLSKSSVIYASVEKPVTDDDLRAELKISADSTVAGFHQRPDNNIASEIPLKAFAQIQQPNWHFVIMGGGEFYRKQAKNLGLQNVHFLEASADYNRVSSFLNTLDIFAHGRKDGETFGTVFAEAMIHGLPCLSHWTGIADAQEETMNKGGLFAANLEDYKDKLKEFFENRELREGLGNFGKKYAEEFYTIDNSVKKLCSVYEKVMEDAPATKIIAGNNLEKNRANRISFRNRIKILVYNKYFFICYRFFRKIFKK
ncbi:MAG: glycosyltransferase family 4 protein [Candidatus Falkowbacteria bacterium]